ncbi:MAG: IS701 family transposase [Candidatus Bathyarchaeota archaeon]|nr:IS701 family transposase [Candidatus Termiticorpusculum sp.]
MIPTNNPYNTKTPNTEILQKIPTTTITKQLQQYLKNYNNCFTRSQQIKYFETYQKGLLSNLNRKTIEPIALHFLGEKQVRGMQQFITRSKGWQQNLTQQYQTQLAKQLNDINGFLSVDESDFPKKGTQTAGIAHQYCGRLGKTENCQAGVFLSYATEKGIGLIDTQLYLPNDWFGNDYAEKRSNCQIPKDLTFKTKNTIAKEMIQQVLENKIFEVQCVGCDCAFGSDHDFLDSLPEFVHYFAGVRETEHIYRAMPEVVLPVNNSAMGRRYKHLRAVERPVSVKSVLSDESVPWVRRVVAEGVKGPIVADVKCLRCVSCRSVGENRRLYVPKSWVWVYIRRYEDGSVKYFLSNMSEGTSVFELDRLASARWSIEQCFLECKSYLGMGHYEVRSYDGWYRHMLFVFVAQLFVTVLWESFKKM